MEAQDTKKENVFIVEMNVENEAEEGKESLFSGVIKYKLPGYVERLKILRTVNYKVDEKEGIRPGDYLDVSIKLAELAMEHIAEVSVIRKSDGFVFDSIDKLQFDNVASGLISVVGNRITSGIAMGKN